MIATICLWTTLLSAADPPATADLLKDLLPRPQQAELTDGEFEFDLARLAFVLRTPSAAEAGRLGERLEEMQDRLGIGHSSYVSEHPVADTYALLVLGGGARPGLEDLRLPAGAEAEGYQLAVSPEGVTVRAGSEHGLFYGMMTLEQLLNSAKVRRRDDLPCLQMVDWPQVAMRGFHEDYGRDQLPTVEDHKRTIRTLAQFKMNTHLWFIEPNHFLYDFDPDIGKDFDRFQFDEIREVVAYAKQYYIEVIPVIELLAHMEWTLNDPKYAHLAETPGGGTLCPTSDESFDLVRQIVNEVAPAFEGRYFHCGLDESQAVGKGRSAEAVKEKGYERVYADYYTRLNDLVKSHGRQMVMYADIVLNHPDVIELLPDDIVMMYWNYGEAEHHPGLDTLVKGGSPTMSLSGLQDWVNVYPLYGSSFKNIERLGVQSAEAGVLGYFVSSWGDGNLGAAGANLSELNWYGVVYCGALGWRPEPMGFETFSPGFALQFFGLATADAAEALTLLATSQGQGRRARYMAHSKPEDQIPAMTKADEGEIALWRTMKERAGRAHVLLKKSRARRNADYLRSHDLAARILEYAADLALEYRATAEALNAPGFKPRAAAEAYEGLAERQRALWHEYHEVYAATNRPINLRYLVRAWDESTRALEAFAAALRKGEMALDATGR